MDLQIGDDERAAAAEPPTPPPAAMPVPEPLAEAAAAIAAIPPEPVSVIAESPDDAATPPTPAPQPAAAPEPDLSFQTRVCTALFGEDLRIPDVKALFAKTYDGSGITWTGRLKNVRHMYSDTVFGDRPGTRAELVIAKVSAGMFGARDVVAIVHLPEGAEAVLRSRVGEDVSFSGRLTGLDPFMREVFVADGVLAT